MFDPEDEGILAIETPVTINISTQCYTPGNLNIRRHSFEKPTPLVGYLFTWIRRISHEFEVAKVFLGSRKGVKEKDNVCAYACLETCEEGPESVEQRQYTHVL